MAQLVALQPADDRKQHRGMTAPGWSGLPHKLQPIRIPQRDQFGPLPDYNGRDVVAMKCLAVLCHMFSRFVFAWPAG